MYYQSNERKSELHGLQGRYGPFWQRDLEVGATIDTKLTFVT